MQCTCPAHGSQREQGLCLGTCLPKALTQGKTKANTYFYLPPLQLGLFIYSFLADLLDLEQIRTSFVPSELSFVSYQIFIVFRSVAVRASQIVFPDACLYSSLPLGSYCMQGTDSPARYSDLKWQKWRTGRGGLFFFLRKQSDWGPDNSKASPVFGLLPCVMWYLVMSHQKSDYPSKSPAFLIK